MKICRKSFGFLTKIASLSQLLLQLLQSMSCSKLCQYIGNSEHYYMHKTAIFNRIGVAAAVLQTPLSFIHSFIHYLTHPFPPNLQDTFTPKAYELGI